MVAVHLILAVRASITFMHNDDRGPRSSPTRSVPTLSAASESTPTRVVHLHDVACPHVHQRLIGPTPPLLVPATAAHVSLAGPVQLHGAGRRRTLRRPVIARETKGGVLGSAISAAQPCNGRNVNGNNASPPTPVPTSTTVTRGTRVKTVHLHVVVRHHVLQRLVGPTPPLLSPTTAAHVGIVGPVLLHDAGRFRAL